MSIATQPHQPHSVDGWIFDWIHRGGCPALFFVLLLCGVGLPLPEDIPLIAAGFFIQKGEMNLALAAICAWCGIIGGDCILYMLGRAFGAEVSKIPFIGRHVNVDRMARVEKWFEHYGVWVVAVGRLFAGIRGAMVVVAGATRFNFIKFIVADSLAAIVSGGLFMYLGYTFARQLHHLLHETVPHIKVGMLIALVVALVALIGYVFWRRRKRRIAALPGFPVQPEAARVSVPD